MEPNSEQAAMWNGPGGRAWVDTQDLLDEVLRPFEELLVATIAAGSGERVLDVGCGTGSTTLAIARRLSATGRCVGLDISEPMLALARARAEREGQAASFVRADAQVHAFEPASFDRIVSRFGVMFFDDPVGAFANLRRAARDGAELRCVVWRSAAENPFMTTGERAAAPLLPDLPARKPGAPGQFSLADRQRVEEILAASGWSDVEIEPIDVTCVMPAKELMRYVTRLGPVGRALADKDERTRAQVSEALRTAFASFVHGDEARFAAACWMIGARAR